MHIESRDHVHSYNLKSSRLFINMFHRETTRVCFSESIKNNILITIYDFRKYFQIIKILNKINTFIIPQYQYSFKMKLYYLSIYSQFISIICFVVGVYVCLDNLASYAGWNPLFPLLALRPLNYRSYQPSVSFCFPQITTRLVSSILLVVIDCAFITY